MVEIATNVSVVASQLRFPRLSPALHLQLHQAYLRYSAINPLSHLSHTLSKPQDGLTPIFKLPFYVSVTIANSKSTEVKTKRSAISNLHRMASKPSRTATAFTPAEDALIVELKEKGDLTWKAIADEFAKRFPTKTHGALQVRYTRNLDTRKFGTKKQGKPAGTIKKESKPTGVVKKQSKPAGSRKRQESIKIKLRLTETHKAGRTRAAANSNEIESSASSTNLRSSSPVQDGEEDSWKKLRFRSPEATTISAEDAARILVAMSAGKR